MASDVMREGDDEVTAYIDDDSSVAVEKNECESYAQVSEGNTTDDVSKTAKSMDEYTSNDGDACIDEYSPMERETDNQDPMLRLLKENISMKLHLEDINDQEDKVARQKLFEECQAEKESLCVLLNQFEMRSNTQDQLHKELRGEIVRLQQVVDDIGQENRELKIAKEELESLATRLDNSLEVAALEQSHLCNRVDDLDMEIGAISSSNLAVSTQLNEISEASSQITGSLVSANTGIDRGTKLAETLRNILVRKNTHNKELKVNLEVAFDRIHRQEVHIHGAEEDLRLAREELRLAREVELEATMSRDKHADETNVVQRKLHQCNSEMSSMRQELVALHEELDNLRTDSVEKNSALQEARQSLKSAVIVGKRQRATIASLKEKATEREELKRRLVVLDTESQSVERRTKDAIATITQDAEARISAVKEDCECRVTEALEARERYQQCMAAEMEELQRSFQNQVSSWKSEALSISTSRANAEMRVENLEREIAAARNETQSVYEQMQEMRDIEAISHNKMDRELNHLRGTEVQFRRLQDEISNFQKEAIKSSEEIVLLRKEAEARGDIEKELNNLRSLCEAHELSLQTANDTITASKTELAEALRTQNKIADECRSLLDRNSALVAEKRRLTETRRKDIKERESSVSLRRNLELAWSAHDAAQEQIVQQGQTILKLEKDLLNEKSDMNALAHTNSGLTNKLQETVLTMASERDSHHRWLQGLQRHLTHLRQQYSPQKSRLSADRSSDSIEEDKAGTDFVSDHERLELLVLDLQQRMAKNLAERSKYNVEASGLQSQLASVAGRTTNLEEENRRLRDDIAALHKTGAIDTANNNRYREETEERVTSQMRTIMDLQSKLATRDTQTDRETGRIRELEDKLKLVTSTVKTWQVRSSEFEKVNIRLNQENTDCRKRFQQLDKKHARLTADREQTRVRTKDIEQKLARALAEVEDARTQIGSLDQRLSRALKDRSEALKVAKEAEARQSSVQPQLQELRRANKDLAAKHTRVAQDRNDTHQRVDELTEQLSAQQQNARFNKKRIVEMENIISALTKDLEMTKSSLSKTDLELSTTVRDAQRLGEHNQHLIDALREVQTENTDLTVSRNSLQHHASELENSKEKLSSTIENLRKEKTLLHNDLLSSRRDIAVIQHGRSSRDADVEIIKNEITDLRQLKGQLQTSLQHAEEGLRTLHKNKDEVDAELVRMSEQLRTSELKISELEHERNQLLEERSEARRGIEALAQEREELSAAVIQAQVRQQ